MYGILGQANLSATTNTLVYTVPSGKYAKVVINVCNRTTSNANIRIALSNGNTPDDAEWIEYNTLLPGNGVLERGDIYLENFKKVIVYSSIANTSVNIYGEEKVG